MEITTKVYDTKGEEIESPPHEEGFYHIMVMSEFGWYWQKVPIEGQAKFVYMPPKGE